MHNPRKQAQAEGPLPPSPPEPSAPRAVPPTPPEGLELDRLIRRSPRGTPARRLLEGAAIFMPQAVPFAWAKAAARLAPKGTEARKARKALQELGLVAVDAATRTLSLHPMVRERVRALASKKTWLARNRRAAKQVARWLEKTVDPSRLAEVEAHWAHLEAALEAAAQGGDSLVWIRINDRLATHLQHRTRYEEARARFEQGLAAAEQLDPAHPAVVATSLSNLAMVLKDLGELAWARSLLERALAISEKTHGSEHPAIAIGLSNLAMVLQVAGQAVEARPLLEYALAIDEKTYGPDHPTFALRLSNLAAVLQDLGQAAQARPLLERALVIAEKTCGPDHPTFALRLSNLAMVLKDLGQANEARPLLERALAIADEALPPDHPIRTTIARNLARL